MQTFCQYCGMANLADARFCTACRKLIAPPTAAPPQPPPNAWNDGGMQHFDPFADPLSQPTPGYPWPDPQVQATGPLWPHAAPPAPYGPSVAPPSPYYGQQGYPQAPAYGQAPQMPMPGYAQPPYGGMTAPGYPPLPYGQGTPYPQTPPYGQMPNAPYQGAPTYGQGGATYQRSPAYDQLPNVPYQQPPAPNQGSAYMQQPGYGHTQAPTPYGPPAAPYAPYGGMYPAPGPYTYPGDQGHGLPYSQPIGSTALSASGSLAGFFPRLGALVVDWCVLAIPWFFFVNLAFSIDAASLGLLTMLLVPAIYFIGFWSTSGRTPGYRAAGLQLLRTDAGKPSLGASTLRFIGTLVSCWCFFLGYLWMLWDDKKQTWHDKMAGTVVVHS